MPAARVDVATIGETMVAFVAQAESTDFVAVTAGAESNVAAGVMALGGSSRWVSRLGNDPLGRLVSREVAGRGVEVCVEIDDRRQTGLMTKHLGAGGTDRRYYRAGSAASAMSPADLARVGQADWVHVTGITPALSPSARDLVEAIADRHGIGTALVSFDVNLRTVLWADTAGAAETLLSIARRCDLVLVGDDEAEVLFGTRDARQIAGMILVREDQELVLKRGPGPASLITRGGSFTEPALGVEVVDPTGAGDAFAAGYLTGRCRGWPAAARLRLGHVMASRVLGTVADTVPAFTAPERARLTPDALAERWTGRREEHRRGRRPP
jgi:2-dehydro-3-deoxygluconokinase